MKNNIWKPLDNIDWEFVPTKDIESIATDILHKNALARKFMESSKAREFEIYLKPTSIRF